MKTRISSFILLTSMLLLFHCGHLKDAKKAYQNNDYQKSIALCKQAIQADSTDIQAYVLTAQSYRKMEEYTKAFQAIVRAKQINPESSAMKKEALLIHLDFGKHYLSKKDNSGAYHQFVTAYHIDSTHYETMVHLANLSFSLGHLDRAASLYQKLVRKASNPEPFKNKMEDIQNRKNEAQSLFEKALVRYKKGQIKNAQSFLQKALKANGDHKDACYYQYMAEGRLLLKKGSRSALWDAIELFGKAAILKNDLPEPRFYMAQGYEKKDRDEFVNAIDEYQKALDLDPEGPLAPACKKKIQDLKKRKDKLDKFWGRKK